MAWSFFGEDNINILDDYFYGGGIGGNVIPITSNGEFLSVVSNYNTLLDDDDTYYLTFNEVIPGVNGQGTNFFTYNEETQTPELVEHVCKEHNHPILPIPKFHLRNLDQYNHMFDCLQFATF